MSRKFQKELPPPPPLGLDVLKTTKTIRKSLGGLQSCLFCPLCNNVFNDPVTLPACGHSFCQRCISDYSCNNYNCPTCNLPITLRGSRSGGFDKTNPQIETVVSSFRTICSALNAAPNQWWNEPKPEEDKYLEVEGDGTYVFDMPREDEEDEDDEGEIDPREEEDEVFEMPDREEEGMDFQIHGPKLTMDDDATELFLGEDCSYSLASRRSCSLPSQSPNCSVIPNMCSQTMAPANDYENEKENINLLSKKEKNKSKNEKLTDHAMTPTINNDSSKKNFTPFDDNNQSISSNIQNSGKQKMENNAKPKIALSDDICEPRKEKRNVDQILSGKENIDQRMTPVINDDNSTKSGTPIDNDKQSISSSIENTKHRKREKGTQPKTVGNNDNRDSRKKSRTSNETGQKSILSSKENIAQPMTPGTINDSSVKNGTPIDISSSSEIRNSETRETISQPKPRAINVNGDVKRHFRTSNETVQKVILSNTEKVDSKKRGGNPRFFIASKLSSKDAKTLKRLEKENAIEIVESLEDNRDVVALCGNVEIETGDGWLIGLTYGYLWAIARGVPLLHVSYSYEGPPYPDPDLKQRVIGIGSSVDWMGPQRALEAKGEKLLHEYTLILIGKFDKLPQSRRGASVNLHTVYSESRIHTLLSLCGATVLNMPIELDQLSSTQKVAFLIRPNPRSVDWRAARKVVDPLDCNIPVISANWLLDSLADYRHKDWNNYTQASRHII